MYINIGIIKVKIKEKRNKIKYSSINSSFFLENLLIIINDSILFLINLFFIFDKSIFISLSIK
jgi:hypothetical protein